MARTRIVRGEQTTYASDAGADVNVAAETAMQPFFLGLPAPRPCIRTQTRYRLVERATTTVDGQQPNDAIANRGQKRPNTPAAGRKPGPTVGSSRKSSAPTIFVRRLGKYLEVSPNYSERSDAPTAFHAFSS